MTDMKFSIAFAHALLRTSFVKETGSS